jgi:hypothetical protein
MLIGARTIAFPAVSLLRRIGVSFVLAVAIAVAVASAAMSAGAPSKIVPEHQRVAGHTYAQWEAALERWRLSLSLDHAAASSSSCATAGQSGKVWFLGGDGGAHAKLIRHCTVPAGRYLIVGVPNAECSTVEKSPFHATTDAALRACARAQFKAALGRGLLAPDVTTLDDVSLKPPAYDVASPAFSFTMPAKDNFVAVPGKEHGRSAVFGSIAILRPLARGKHTLIVPFDLVNPTRPTGTYELTVK